MTALLPPPRRVTRAVAIALGIPFLAGLAMLTLTPSRVEERVPNLLDRVLGVVHRLGWSSIGFNELEVLANILVFTPIGILAFLFLPRRVWILSFLAGPAISFAIEGTQRLALPHRAATIADVIANSAGATIGVLLAVTFTLLFAPRPSPRPSPTLEAS